MDSLLPEIGSMIPRTGSEWLCKQLSDRNYSVTVLAAIGNVDLRNSMICERRTIDGNNLILMTMQICKAPTL